MRRLPLAAALCLLLAAPRPATAAAEPEPAADRDSGAELTVSGPAGAFLRVDDKPVGHLPIETPFLVTAGPHRFQLERQGRRYQSDLLTLPQGRVAELSLSPGSQGTAIAVLSLTPMVLLAVRCGDLDDKKQQELRAAVQEAVRAEHSVLVPPKTAAAVALRQPPDCLAKPECQLGFAAAAEARLVLRLERPPAAPAAGGPCLRGELLDVKTGQSALRDEQACSGGDEQLPDAAQQLSRRLLSGVAKLGRGIVMVTSQPDAAQVFIDGQPRGLTPWEGASLPGLREVVVKKPDYEPQRTQVTVVAEQSMKVQLALTPIVSEPEPASLLPPPPPPPPPPPLIVPVEPPRRPRWRIISGGVALGVGAIIAGLGVAGVAKNGTCADEPPTAGGNCSYLYSTAGLGAGALVLGLTVAAVGGALIAAPARGRNNTGVQK